MRLHPLIENRKWVPPEVELIFDRNTVSLDLKAIDSNMKVFDPKARNKVRRARISGVKVSARTDTESFSRFVSMYIRTMERLNAADEYFFTPKYFQELEQIVRKNGWLVTGELDKQMVVASIFLRGEESLHYHLSCTNPKHVITGAVNLVIYQGALLGKEFGLKRQRWSRLFGQLNPVL